MRIYLLSLCLMVFPLSADSLKPSVDVEPARDVFTAEQILERMAKVYAECRTYSDTGLVETTFFTDRGKRIAQKPFTTAFVRQLRFRFEFKSRYFEDSDELRYIIWCEGDRVRTWWDVKPGIEEKESLSRAVGAATGVSSASSRTIPALLMPDRIGGRRLTALAEPERIEDADLGNVECFRIKGKTAERPITIWVDKANYLVRRIDTQQEFDDFRTERTTTYEPTIDREIAEELLKFDPPAK